MSSAVGDDVLLVPLANPETVDRLLDTVIDIAVGRSMAVLLMHVVEVPAQVPLSEGKRLIESDGAEVRMIEQAASRCSQAGVSIDTTFRYARDVANGIVSGARDHHVSMILMGWRGRPRRREIVLGTFLDRVMRDAQCDMLVRRIEPPTSPISTILVPIAGGPHCGLSVEIAGAIAGQHDATVHLIHVLSSDSSSGEKVLSTYRSRLEDDGIETTSEIVRSDNVRSTLVDQSASHDLTILGASEQSIIRRKLVGSVAHGVGREAANQVLLTRKYHPA